MEYLVYNDGLSISMAIMSTILLALVMLVFLTGLLKKKETMKDTLLMCNMMFAFLAYAVFQMIAVVLETLVDKDNALSEMASMWCKFVGAIGVFAITNPLGATLIFSFHLLYDQIQSETSKRNKHTFIKASIFVQYVILIVIAAIPCLPIASFEAAQPCNEQTLCLPLTSPGTELKGWNSFLLVMEVLTAIVTITILIFVSYRMHRQQSLLSSMIPMEARVLRKKATKVKRIGLLLLTILAFRLPGVGALLGLALYPLVTIAHTTIQWVFGFIVPLGEVVACALYLFMIGCKKSIQKRYFKYRPREYDTKVESLSGNQQVSPNLYTSTDDKGDMVNYEKSPTKMTVNFFHGVVPSEVSWIRDAVIPDGFKGRYGIIEWQTQNGSPRRGLMKVFPPSQYKSWTWESSTLARLNRLGHHDNIVSFLWATTSTSCKIAEQQGNEPIADELKLERYLCTAYYPHGTLREVLQTYPKKFRENLAHNLLLQVSKGIVYLHDNHMSHQDLNTKNIHVGGKIETMSLRIVISNFSKAMDLSKQSQRKKEEFSDFTIYQEIDPPKSSSDTSVKKPTTENMHLVVEEVQRLYANDVRAFALIMLEILETVRMHFLPKDVCVRFSEGHKYSMHVPEITIPRLPSAEYDFNTDARRDNDEGIDYNSGRVYPDSLPTEAELSLTRGTPKRNSGSSSTDSGISSNRTSMRSKGSSVGSSFGKKKDSSIKDPPKQKISKLSQIKRRALARNGGARAAEAMSNEVETDTTEVTESISSVEELDQVGYLPNFPKDYRVDDGPCSPPIHPSQLPRKGSSPAVLSSVRATTPVNEDNSELPSSALPRASNSFSKFYVIRSKGLDGTSSPKVSSRRRSSPIPENVLSESESDTRSTPDEIPLSAMGRGFYDGTSNYNSLPRGGSRVISEDPMVQAYQSSEVRRGSEPNITPAIDYGQHSLPRKPKKPSEDRCPSNLTNRHMMHCQDMLSVLEGLRAVTLMNRIHVKEDCHKMVTRWLATQKMDTCLYKQMTHILKSAWTREPPYIAGLIFRKLDNCLTEVDL